MTQQLEEFTIQLNQHLANSSLSAVYKPSANSTFIEFGNLPIYCTLHILPHPDPAGKFTAQLTFCPSLDQQLKKLLPPSEELPRVLSLNGNDPAKSANQIITYYLQFSSLTLLHLLYHVGNARLGISS